MEATFRAYDRMMEILDEVARTQNVGSNVVLLHAHAYDPIRKETALPSRLVTLGLRDRAAYRAAVRHWEWVLAVPCDVPFRTSGDYEGSGAAPFDTQ